MMRKYPLCMTRKVSETHNEKVPGGQKKVPGAQNEKYPVCISRKVSGGCNKIVPGGHEKVSSVHKKVYCFFSLWDQ